MTCPLHTAPQSFCARCAPSAIEPGIDPETRAAFRSVVGNPLLRETVVGEMRDDGYTDRGMRETITGSGQSSPVPHVTIEPVSTETRCGKCNNWSLTTRWRAGFGCPFGCRASAVEVRVLPPVDALPSPSHDAQSARIAGLEQNVNEKLATIAARDATIAGLRTQLRETEIRRCNASATIKDITDALEITAGHDDLDDDEALAEVRAYIDDRKRRDATYDSTIAALHDEIAQLRSVESVAIAGARIASLAAALRVALADVDPKAMSTYEQQAQRRHARALLEEV
jgi:hypothetical protein